MFSSTIDVAVRLPIKQLMQSFPTDVAAEKDMVQIVTGTIRHHLSGAGPSAAFREISLSETKKYPIHHGIFPSLYRGENAEMFKPPPPSGHMYNTRYG